MRRRLRNIDQLVNPKKIHKILHPYRQINTRGTEYGSDKPHSPDQESVAAQVIGKRFSKPPRSTEHDLNPMEKQSTPGSPLTKEQSILPLYMHNWKKNKKNRGTW